jgi:hypothetical protein
MLIYCIMTLASNLLLMLTMLEANKPSGLVALDLFGVPVFLEVTKVNGSQAEFQETEEIMGGRDNLPLMMGAVIHDPHQQFRGMTTIAWS